MALHVKRNKVKMHCVTQLESWQSQCPSVTSYAAAAYPTVIAANWEWSRNKCEWTHGHAYQILCSIFMCWRHYNWEDWTTVQFGRHSDVRRGRFLLSSFSVGNSCCLEIGWHSWSTRISFCSITSSSYINLKYPRFWAKESYFWESSHLLVKTSIFPPRNAAVVERRWLTNTG